MSPASLPAARPAGRALVIGSPSCRSTPLETLQRAGYTCAEADDPYTAMAELCRRPLAYRAIILSLASLYREEMTLIEAVKSRWPHIDVWIAQSDGRHAALADAMRFGADGLISENGLHRTGQMRVAIGTAYPKSPASPATAAMAPEPSMGESDIVGHEPILTAEELRALLADHPVALPEQGSASRSGD